MSQVKKEKRRKLWSLALGKAQGFLAFLIGLADPLVGMADHTAPYR